MPYRSVISKNALRSKRNKLVKGQNIVNSLKQVSQKSTLRVKSVSKWICRYSEKRRIALTSKKGVFTSQIVFSRSLNES